MGLYVSHEAFSGPYSAFNRLRQFVCAATGGSFPPHWIYGDKGIPVRDEHSLGKINRTLDDNYFYIDDTYTAEDWPGLREFLAHSDCDGEIDPVMCSKIADDLERLMPQMEAMDWEAHGRIARYGGFIATVQQFIKGCRAAAEAGEPLKFD